MKFVHWFVLGCACALPLAANAQWQWIDKDGRKVFSDKPPPPDIPDKNVLRQPSVRSSKGLVIVHDDPSASMATAPAKNADTPKPPGVDKDLEEKTRKAEEAEKAKRAAEEQKVAKARAENCTRARQSKATLDSGIRLARTNEKGEREILDDQARAEEQKRLDSVIASDCK